MTTNKHYMLMVRCYILGNECWRCWMKGPLGKLKSEAKKQGFLEENYIIEDRA